jgi:hypothetical protein
MLVASAIVRHKRIEIGVRVWGVEYWFWVETLVYIVV